MEQIAFLIRLKPGHEAESRRRHDEIGPELEDTLRAAGIYDYAIFLDSQTLNPFAALKLRPDNTRETLASLPVTHRWWDHMADIMDVDAANKPVKRPPTRVFYRN